MNRLGKYDSIIADASEKFGIDPNVIKSVILTESAANEKAVSGAKAKGLMQLIDSTAHDMGVQNVWDPKQNILGGTKYLAEMLRKYNGNLRLALASYNAGPSNVDKYNGIPPFEETQNYVTRVFGYLKHLNGESYGND
jgi:soluble lytic murein transglycosylase-like protein